MIKIENGQIILYVNKYFEKNLSSGTETTHYYLGGRRIAFKKGNDLEYTHEDHLTGTSVTTDENGIEVATVKYFPFGEARTDLTNVNTDKLFTGQRLDDTGLYYYNARYYDAEIGRFISPDTIVPDWTNPQSLNRYSYCLNNPLKYVDPSGHDVWGFGLGEFCYSKYLTGETVETKMRDSHGGYAIVQNARVGLSVQPDISLGLISGYWSSADSILDLQIPWAYWGAVEGGAYGGEVEFNYGTGTEWDGDRYHEFGGELAFSRPGFNVGGGMEVSIIKFMICPYTNIEAPHEIFGGFDSTETIVMWYDSGVKTRGWDTIVLKDYTSYYTCHDCLMSILEQPYHQRKAWGVGNLTYYEGEWIDTRSLGVPFYVYNEQTEEWENIGSN